MKKTVFHDRFDLDITLRDAALDADNRPHIAYYELPTNARTSTGTVNYAVGSAPTSVRETDAVPDS